MNATGKSAGIKHDIRRYEDLLGLPHHVSTAHPPMSMRDRAAQFAPFAALTGHEAAIRETARLTETRVEPAEDVQAMLNEKLRLLGDAIESHPAVTVTYFRPDAKKAGGAYVRAAGRVKKLDAYERKLVLCGGARIPIGDIAALEGALFAPLEDEGG